MSWKTSLSQFTVFCSGITNVLLDNSTLLMNGKKNNQIHQWTGQLIVAVRGDHSPSFHHRSCHTASWDTTGCFLNSAAVSLWVNEKDYVERHHWYYNITHFMSNAWSRQSRTASYDTSSWCLRLNLPSSNQHCEHGTRLKTDRCFGGMNTDRFKNCLIMAAASCIG